MKDRIRILVTSDVHGYCFPYDYADGTEKDYGFARLSTLIKLLKEGQTAGGGDSFTPGTGIVLDVVQIVAAFCQDHGCAFLAAVPVTTDKAMGLMGVTHILHMDDGHDLADAATVDDLLQRRPEGGKPQHMAHNDPHALAFGGLGDLLKGPVNTVIGMLNGMISAVENAINAVVDGINSHLSFDFRWKKPDWMGGGYLGFSWSPNLQRVSWGHINYLAEGAILDMEALLGLDGMQPIVAGEAGREAVLPLDSNTKWMDDVAEHVNAYAERNVMSYGANYNDYDERVNATDVSEIERALRLITRYLEIIERKDTNVEITTAQIANAQQRANRRSGVTVIPVNT